MISRRMTNGDGLQTDQTDLTRNPLSRREAMKGTFLPTMNMRTALAMNRRTLAVIAIPVLVLFLLGTTYGLLWRYIIPRQPTGTAELVARIELHDSTELVLVQTFTGTMEPYVVELWYCDVSGTWHGFYVDHEALRWQGEFEVIGNDDVIFRTGRRYLLWFHLPTQTLKGPGKRKSRSAIYKSDMRPYR